jgi:hypothetical protein
MEGLALILLYVAIPSLFFSAVQKFLSWKKKSSTEAKFPGPQQFPIVGRVHDLPRFALWLKFKEWADIHGPIYETHALDTTFVVVSDVKIAEELLVKRGHIYSGRPQIRALIKHKDGPAYSALMDRHGRLLQGWTSCSESKLTASTQTSGRHSASGAMPPWPRPTSTTSMATSRWR